MKKSHDSSNIDFGNYNIKESGGKTDQGCAKAEAARWTDTCPRGILGGKTPAEAFAMEFNVGQKTLNKLGVVCL